MRVTQPLDDLFDNPNNIKLLRHLTLYPSPVITGRGLARELGMSHVTCIRSLDRLTNMGIVDRRRVGKSSTYEIASGSVLCEDILKPAFEIESRLLSSLVDNMVKGVKREIYSVYLFGSVARSEDTPSSDVDILILTESPGAKLKVHRAVESNKEAVYQKHRVGVTAMIYDLTEFNRMKKRKDPLINEVLKEGVLIMGKEVR
jgi:predicted nucleotidyltransferase/predicted transcriptional regulator